MIDAVVAAIAAFFGFILRDLYTRHRSEQEASRQNVLTFGMPVVIGVSAGSYVTTEANDNNTLIAREKQMGAAEQFELVHPEDAFAAHLNRPVRYGEKVALRTLAQHQFVRAALDSQGELVADAADIGDWETFKLCPTRGRLWPWSDKSVYYGSAFALQARNHQYVTYDAAGGQRLSASSPQIKRWETFVFIKPDTAKGAGGS